MAFTKKGEKVGHPAKAPKETIASRKPVERDPKNTANVTFEDRVKLWERYNGAKQGD